MAKDARNTSCHLQENNTVMLPRLRSLRTGQASHARCFFNKEEKKQNPDVQQDWAVSGFIPVYISVLKQNP